MVRRRLSRRDVPPARFDLPAQDAAAAKPVDVARAGGSRGARRLRARAKGSRARAYFATRARLRVGADVARAADGDAFAPRGLECSGGIVARAESRALRRALSVTDPAVRLAWMLLS